MITIEKIKAITEKREAIKDIIIKRQMERDIEGLPCWTTVVLDLSTGEQTIHQYADGRSWSPLGDDEIELCSMEPTTRKWFEDYCSIEEIADALEISRRDLIEEMEGWMLNEGYDWEVIEDEGSELDVVYDWIESEAAPEIVEKLKEAYVEWLETDIYPVYAEQADRDIDELIEHLESEARAQAEKSAFESGWY